MKRLLIVVDYQKDFVDGSLGFPGAESIDEAIAAKIDAYHQAGDMVMFTMDTHTPAYLNTQEGKNLPVEHCLDGTDGWRLYGKTGKARLDRDQVLRKPTFGSIELGEHLKKAYDASAIEGLLPYTSIELIGLVSNICVLSNAVIVKAACPEVPVSVDAACTASHDDKLNEETLDILEGLQIEVTNRPR